MEKMTELPPRC